MGEGEDTAGCGSKRKNEKRDYGYDNKEPGFHAKNALEKNRPALFSDYTPEDESEGEDPLLRIEDTRTDVHPEEAYLESERSELLKGLMDCLTEEQRMAVMMFYMEELSLKEIANALETNENTVKSRLFKARKALNNKAEEMKKKGYVFSAAPLPLLIALLKNEKSRMHISAVQTVTDSVVATSENAAGRTAGRAALKRTFNSSAEKGIRNASKTASQADEYYANGTQISETTYNSLLDLHYDFFRKLGGERIYVSQSGGFETHDANHRDLSETEMLLSSPSELLEGYSEESPGIDALALIEEYQARIIEEGAAAAEAALQASYDTWMQAYADFLRTQETEWSYYSLIYLNSDDIPELVTNNGWDHYSTAHLYTFRNGQLEDMGDRGMYGEFSYVPKKSVIYRSSVTSFLYSTEVYTVLYDKDIARGEAHQFMHSEMVDSSGEGSLADYGVVPYSIDGVEVDRETFEKALQDIDLIAEGAQFVLSSNGGSWTYIDKSSLNYDDYESLFGISG